MTNWSPSVGASFALPNFCDILPFRDPTHTIDGASAILLSNLPFRTFWNYSDDHATFSSTSVMWSRISLPPESSFYRLQSLIPRPSNTAATHYANETSQEIAEVILYLISNNHLTSEDTSKVLESIVESMPASLLKTLFFTRSPTVLALSTRFLETAAESGWFSIIQLFIRHGIDTNLLARLPGFKLLQKTLEGAMFFGDRHSEREKIVKLLISHGAYVHDALCDREDIPLYIARENGFPNIAKDLVKVGAKHEPTFNGMRRRLSEMICELACWNDVEEIPPILELQALLLNSNPRVVESFSAFGLIAAAENGLKTVREYLDGFGEEVDLEQRNIGIIHALCCIMRKRVNPEIMLLLAEQIDPHQGLLYDDSQMGFRPSPLAVAVELRYWTVAEAMIENGMTMDLNRHNLNSIDADILKFLIDNDGVNLEKYGPEAVLYALGKKDKKVVSILVEAGVRLESVIAELKYRTNFLTLGMLEWLVEVRADSDLFNVDFLSIAIRTGNFDAIGFLCEFVDINLPNSDGEYPVQIAMNPPSLKMVRFLQELGADLNPFPNQLNGLSTLNYALRGADRQILDLVIEGGAEFQPRNSMCLKETLYESCFAGHGQHTIRKDTGASFRFLLANGAAPTICQRETRSEDHPVSALTSLILYFDSEDLIHNFIEAGADVNESGGLDSTTPLQAAASKGSTELVECLLEKGAEINASAGRSFGRTALQAACIRHGEKGYMPPIKLLLSRGADVNASAGIKYGVTALQATAIGGNLQAAILLLEAGAYVNAEGAIEGGRKALDGAAEHGRLDMVQFLLNAGACSHENDDGTPGFGDTIRLAEEESHWAVSDLIRSHIRMISQEG